MITTLTGPDRAGTTAAAGGDQAVQLRHLRGHRAFQRQERHSLLRIDWATTITREQSRLHITREIHRKINLKGGITGAGRHEGPEVQQTLQRTARMALKHERLSPGDLCGMGWKLRSRIIGAQHPGRRPTTAGEETKLAGSREMDFPPEIQRGLARHRRLRELLALQGASPGRARRSMILEVLRCPECSLLIAPGPLETDVCPGCGEMLDPKADPVEIAVSRKDGLTPVGNVPTPVGNVPALAGPGKKEGTCSRL